MGKGVRVGIIVEAIVLVAAIVLSIAYFRMGLFRSDKGFDIWLLIVWVLVAAILLFILWSRSLTRVGVPGDEASYTDLGSYENVRELARLLEDNGAFL